jgi:hypothetical protein
MNSKHQLAVLGREQEVLPAPPRSRESPALERRERWVGCLQCRDVSGTGSFDRRRGDERIELANPGLDFWKLRHRY